MSTGKKKGFFSDAADKLLKPRSIRDFNQTSIKVDNPTSFEDSKNVSREPDLSGTRQPDNRFPDHFGISITKESENPLNLKEKVPHPGVSIEVKSADKIKWEFRISKDLAEAVTCYLYKKSDINNRLYRQDLIVQALEEFLEKEGFWKKKK